MSAADRNPLIGETGKESLDHIRDMLLFLSQATESRTEGDPKTGKDGLFLSFQVVLNALEYVREWQMLHVKPV